MFRRAIITGLFVVTLAASSYAQFGVRGQIFLPNGAPVQKRIRFTLTTDNGTRRDYYYTDSNGRIALPNLTSAYTITVETDDETFDTTTASFVPPYSGNYIIVNLNAPKAAPSRAPGLVNVNDVDQKVTPKAKEAYDSAITLLQADQLEQAVEPLKRAIALQPDYFHAHNDLGVLYLKLDRLDEAQVTLQQAIKINGKIYIPQLNLGIVLNRQGRFKEAAEALTRLQRDNPDLWKVHGPLIEALIGSQQWEAADAAITRALGGKELDQVDLKVKLGMVRLRQGKYVSAAAVLREAAAEEPQNALAHFNLGAALLQDGKLLEAEAALQRAYEIKGARMAGTQLLLGQLYYQKQEYQKAIDAFTTYLRDLPDAPNASQVKESIRRLNEALNKK
ncbi:MAG TPA: tetratricopeptide repeat protein [Blastocatellia bacterium]|nr:tetratricopeptide repeat protein [Blastocatellia bacterium]